MKTLYCPEEAKAIIAELNGLEDQALEALEKIETKCQTCGLDILENEGGTEAFLDWIEKDGEGTYAEELKAFLENAPHWFGCWAFDHEYSHDDREQSWFYCSRKCYDEAMEEAARD